MSLFSASQRPVERRSIDGSAFYTDLGHMGSGMEHALRLIPVYSAVSLIADSIATLPRHGFKMVAGSPKRLDPEPGLISSPQIWGSRITWTHQAVTSLALRGNAYGLVTVQRNGWAEKIAWLHPDRMQVDETGAVPIYRYNGKEIDRQLITHISGFTLPGSVVGMSPIAAFRMQLGKGLAAQQYAADYYKRGVSPVGVLRNKQQELKDGDAELAKKRFKAAVAGRDIFVTGNDWEWDSLSVSQEDAQFLSSIEASATEIAAIYRVAPEDIGGKTGHSRQYTTLAMEERKFGQRTLLPYTARLEEAIGNLMKPTEYMKFNLDARIRAELKERYEAHEIALRTGLETLEEARALEEKPPLTDAEIKQWRDWYSRSIPSATQTRSFAQEESQP